MKPQRCTAGPPRSPGSAPQDTHGETQAQRVPGATQEPTGAEEQEIRQRGFGVRAVLPYLTGEGIKHLAPTDQHQPEGAQWKRAEVNQSRRGSWGKTQRMLGAWGSAQPAALSGNIPS